MEEFKRNLVSIIQAAFSGKAFDVSPDFNWENAIRVANKHAIVPIVYYGALACRDSKKEKYMDILHRLTLMNTMVSTRQMYEIVQIEKEFEAENISYMPLKGAILKKIYPKPEMRTMGDADILIKLEQYPKVKSIMEQRGFAFQHETDHELVWKKATLYLELHKSVMTSYNKDFYRYFGTGWEIAKNIPNSSRYEMSPEDFYIYAFVHFTKHYRISGIGIKHLIDLWVYTNAHPQLNWTYIENELEKMHLSEFHVNVRRTIDVWFNGDEETDVTDLITNVIFNSGQYGSAEMAIVNRSLQNGRDSALQIKVARVFRCVFLPYSSMKEKYPILNNLPILLPVMWVVRCFEVLFRDKARLNGFLSRAKQIDNTQINENRQALNAVGLDFDIDE